MNVEDAYTAIAQEAALKGEGADWQRVVIEFEIFNRMATAVHWFFDGDRKFQLHKSIPLDVKELSLDAVLFLRDDLLSNTGDRIWGLTFILTGDGIFNIEYSYEKPDDYEV